MHLAMYFPGGYLPGQDPFDERLAWVTIHALEQVGAVVLPVRYDDSVVDSDKHRFESGVRREIRGALLLYEPSRLTLVGKSRGTHALALACTEDFGLPADTRVTGNPEADELNATDPLALLLAMLLDQHTQKRRPAAAP